MLRFFRQIRQRLLTDNKFSKYLLYAVGEILLVVIGILIALQVDTWNETQQNKDRIDELLNNMLVELDGDIEDIKDRLEYYHRKDSAIYLILNDKLTEEDYWNDKVPYVQYVELNYAVISFREDSFNELKKYYENFPDNYKPIIPEITQLYLKDHNGVKLWNNKMVETHFDNIEHRATYDWYTQPFPNEKLIDYCVNSIDRKNRVEVYKGYARNHYYQLLRTLNNTTDLYKLIAQLLNKPGINQSFTIDEETLNFWTGNYYPELDEGDELIVFADEGLLYWRNTNDTTRTKIFPITNTKGFSNRLGFITLLTEEDHTYIRGNDYSYMKVVD